MKIVLSLSSFGLALATFACFGPSEPPTTDEGEQSAAQTEGAKPSGGATRDGAGKDASAPPSTSGEKPEKGTVEADESPADPACVAQCNASLKSKCDQDDTFCTATCRFYTTAFVGCLAAASSCAKTEWIRCVRENPSPSSDETPSKK